MIMRIQKAKEGCYLYKDNTDGYREFATKIYFAPNDNRPEWPECTDAEKQDWESKHPQPQPESEKQSN